MSFHSSGRSIGENTFGRSVMRHLVQGMYTTK